MKDKDKGKNTPRKDSEQHPFFCSQRKDGSVSDIHLWLNDPLFEDEAPEIMMTLKSSGTWPAELDIAECFSLTYRDARKKFMETAERAGFVIRSIQHPLIGPQGEELFCDTAEDYPDDMTRLVIVACGVHGVEGYAGSGCLSAWLWEIKTLMPYSEGTGILLIHGLNPWGFAWDRRADENNIDVNRNFVTHGTTYPECSGYDDLADVLVPKDWTGPVRDAAEMEIVDYIGVHEMHTFLQHALGGQYTHPEGVCYGGRKKTWSNRTFRKILRAIPGSVTDVVFIDIHAGLGEWGKVSPYYNFEKEEMERVKRIFDIETLDMDEIRSNPDVYYETKGDTLHAIKDILSDRTVTSLCLELGTVDIAKLVEVLRGEAWLFSNGIPETTEEREIKVEIFRSFYPSSADWQISVYREVRSYIERAIHYNSPRRFIYGGL